jgi:hypothetical protein
MKDEEAIIHPKRRSNLLFRDIALLVGLVLVFVALAAPEHFVRGWFNSLEQGIAPVIGQLNPDTVIACVKRGHFYRFEHTTIGNAFDAYFENPKWECKRDENGMQLVEFMGQIKRNIIGYNGVCPFLLEKGDRLRFQFKVEPKNNTLKVYSMMIQLAPNNMPDETQPEFTLARGYAKDLHGMEIKYDRNDTAMQFINSFVEEIFQSR